ncbi:MAG: ATP-binding protein [Chitinophagales bacterium]
MNILRNPHIMQTDSPQVGTIEERLQKNINNADFICSSNPIEGIKLARALYKEAEGHGKIILQAQALATIGFGYYVSKDYPKGLKVLNQALEIYTAHHHTEGIANAQNWKGLIYHSVGDTDKALDIHFQSLELIEKQDSSKQEALVGVKGRVYSNLGMIYGYVGNALKSIEYYEKSLEIKTHNKDISYSNLASNYSSLGEHEKALEYLLEAYELNKISKRLLYKGFIVSNMIGTLGDLGRYEEVLERIKELNTFADGLKNTFFNNLYNACLLSMYIECVKRTDLEVFKQIMAEIEIAEILKNINDSIENTDNIKIQIRSAKLLSAYHEVFENWKEAWRYERKGNELNAKKFEKEKMETVQRLYIKHEVAQKEQKIKIQKLELEKRELELKGKKELEKINHQLEETVAKRTAKLTLQNQQLREFAFIVSHDLREPLCNIHGITDLLVATYEGEMDEEMQMFVSQIGNSAQYMNRLLKDLLDYTTLEKKIEEEGFQKIDAMVVLQGAKNALKLEIAESKAQIEVDQLPVLYSSVHAIRILFEQLLSNSLKFRFPDKVCKVKITCIEEANVYRFAIKDNGIGMDKSHKERIFMAFQRLEKYGYTGTGIGLAICKKTVQILDGTIWVESELGKGSTFYFELPKLGKQAI